MTSTNAAREPRAAGLSPTGAVAPQRAVQVYSCSRIGRSANPPRRPLTGWLPVGRGRG